MSDEVTTLNDALWFETPPRKVTLMEGLAGLFGEPMTKDEIAHQAIVERESRAVRYGLGARKSMERPAFRIREAYDKLLQRCGL